MQNTKHREQIADLILTDCEGNDLEIVSDLKNEKGSSVFEVGNFDTKERWKVTVTIEEL